jgi:hypothetical protein
MNPKKLPLCCNFVKLKAERWLHLAAQWTTSVPAHCHKVFCGSCNCLQLSGKVREINSKQIAAITRFLR